MCWNESSRALISALVLGKELMSSSFRQSISSAVSSAGTLRLLLLRLLLLLGELDLDLDLRSGLEEGDLDLSLRFVLGLKDDDGGVESVDEAAVGVIGVGAPLFMAFGDSCLSWMRGFRVQSRERWCSCSRSGAPPPPLAAVRMGTSGSSLL